MILYIAGPYRGNVEQNIANARKVAIAVWEAGHVALCPHLNTANFNDDCKVPDSAYLMGDLQLLSKCDGIVMVEGWEESEGARVERATAMYRDIPVFYFPELPE